MSSRTGDGIMHSKQDVSRCPISNAYGILLTPVQVILYLTTRFVIDYLDSRDVKLMLGHFL